MTPFVSQSFGANDVPVIQEQFLVTDRLHHPLSPVMVLRPVVLVQTPTGHRQVRQSQPEVQTPMVHHQVRQYQPEVRIRMDRPREWRSRPEAQTPMDHRQVRQSQPEVQIHMDRPREWQSQPEAQTPMDHRQVRQSQPEAQTPMDHRQVRQSQPEVQTHTDRHRERQFQPEAQTPMDHRQVRQSQPEVQIRMDHPRERLFQVNLLMVPHLQPSILGVMASVHHSRAATASKETLQQWLHQQNLSTTTLMKAPSGSWTCTMSLIPRPLPSLQLQKITARSPTTWTISMRSQTPMTPMRFQWRENRATRPRGERPRLW